MAGRGGPVDQRDVAILGAGPAGLGVALALGDRALVLERAPEAVGLGATVAFAGAVFDLGGHSFHTPHPAVRDLVFGALAMEEQRREAWCFVAGEWVPYPFQRNLDSLKNAEMREACESGLAAAGDGTRSPDFGHYIEARFGHGIARHFLRPYNEKLWQTDLRRLATDWTAERVAAPAKVAEGFLSQGGQRKPLQQDTVIAYPAEGGFGEIFRALAARLNHLHPGESVIRIDPARRELVTAPGARIAWRRLVSTLPLPSLLALLPAVPAAIAEAAAGLEALPVNLVMVALADRLATTMQRVYCPDAAIAGHKFVLNHNSSRALRERSRHGIQVEISGRRPESDAALTQRVIADIETMGLIPRGAGIVASRVIRLPYGYPVPTHDRATRVAEIAAWLEAQGIATVGRFGEWAYINSDEALHRGLALGERLAAEAQ